MHWFFCGECTQGLYPQKLAATTSTKRRAVLLGASIQLNAAGTGGGIYVGSGGLTLKTGYTLGGNTATTGGGGMLIAGGNVTVSSISRIIGNSAANSNGGGIYNLSGTLTLNNVAIGPSNSAINGGGMYLANGSTTTFNGVNVNGNNATGKGKGVAFEKGAFMNGLPAGLNDADDNGNPVQV